MSFIFDALRKSEAERQDGRPPGLADVRRAIPRSRAVRWAPLAVAVLAANLLLLWLIWRGQAPPVVAVPAPAPASVSEAPGAVTPAAPPAAVPPPPVRSAAPAAAPAPEPLREVRPLARETLPRTPAAPPAATPATRRAVDAITPGEELGLPRLEELVGSGRLNLPPLALELHVWSELAASRFVFINSARYREGERLAEGPLVEQITTSGVVLSQGGERFVLSRQ